MHTASGSAAAIRCARLLVVHALRLDRLDAEPRGGLGHGRRGQLAAPAASAGRGA